MLQPAVFDDRTGRQCRYLRIKQAGNIWNEKFTAKMKSLGFVRLKTDYCYFARQDKVEIPILIVWADDILSIFLNDVRNDRKHLEFKGNSTLNSIGWPYMLVGIKPDQTDYLITLSQSYFVNSLINELKSGNSNQYQLPPSKHQFRRRRNYKNLSDK